MGAKIPKASSCLTTYLEPKLYIDMLIWTCEIFCFKVQLNARCNRQVYAPSSILSG